MSLLTTHQLCKNYGGVVATRNVDFTIKQNDIHALIGPNGAGKSTFVGLLSGRILPSAGKIIYQGRDITQLPAYKRVALGIAYSFQITSIYKNLSVYDNVALGVQRQYELSGLFNKKMWHDTIINIIERVGLANKIHDTAGLLSYGHQRLLEIGMALGLNPTLLICDEPTQGLHNSEIKDFMALLRHEKQNRTILLIDHNMDVVMDIADTITVLNLGEKLADGTPEQIKANPAVLEAYLHG